MKIVLHIDRLVLNGVAEHDRDAFVHALEVGLARELARPGVASSWIDSGQRAGMRTRLAAVPDPAALGQSCARSIATGAMR